MCNCTQIFREWLQPIVRNKMMWKRRNSVSYYSGNIHRFTMMIVCFINLSNRTQVVPDGFSCEWNSRFTKTSVISPRLKIPISRSELGTERAICVCSGRILSISIRIRDGNSKMATFAVMLASRTLFWFAELMFVCVNWMDSRVKNVQSKRSALNRGVGTNVVLKLIVCVVVLVHMRTVNSANRRVSGSHLFVFHFRLIVMATSAIHSHTVNKWTIVKFRADHFGRRRRSFKMEGKCVTIDRHLAGTIWHWKTLRVKHAIANKFIRFAHCNGCDGWAYGSV